MEESMPVQSVRSEKQLLRRKIHLKGQALKLIRAEQQELRDRLYLLGIKARLESQMTGIFDPALSLKLDCVIALLDGERGRMDG